MTPAERQAWEAKMSRQRVKTLPSQARYYRSTSVTADGLGQARLVGFTEQQWQELEALLQQAGFRPY